MSTSSNVVPSIRAAATNVGWVGHSGAAGAVDDRVAARVSDRRSMPPRLVDDGNTRHVDSWFPIKEDFRPVRNARSMDEYFSHLREK